MIKKRNRNLNERVRNWCLLCYDDPKDCIPGLLESCEHYAYSLHDKDVKADGSPDEPHYHVLLILRNAKTATAVMSYNLGSQNILPDPLTSRVAQYRYLTHKDHKDKYQYSDDVVVCDDKVYWDTLADTPTSKSGENILNICDDINAGKPKKYMIITYGHYYLVNRDKLELMAQLLRAETISGENLDPEAIRLCPPDEFPF